MLAVVDEIEENRVDTFFVQLEGLENYVLIEKLHLASHGSFFWQFYARIPQYLFFHVKNKDSLLLLPRNALSDVVGGYSDDGQLPFSDLP